MKLQDIYIYPIKSLGGIRLASAKLEERGIQYDRRWMLVDAQGCFLSQRTHPQMALLGVSVLPEGLRITHKMDKRQSILVPFTPETNRMIPVSIWEDLVAGQVVSKTAGRWFSEILRMPCELVMMPENIQRKIDPKYAVKGETVSYADAMPYLLIGQASLDDLNARLENPVPMNRFRPNLVFSGGIPYEDDGWKTLRIGDAVFKITKPCARCVLTTVDQATAKKGKEPLRTLAGYRNVGGKVLFGQNMLLLGGSSLHVGDALIPSAS
ncbi:Flavodoxin reductases (ferredoxin-NADPH reductases) family 1 [Lunatimonas lonarensis]|uniref:Flavodoxin reductases (Ferredoxin-NADPH reductases) family 1 n=1 Tax=Lunatimonas lonarensis TaxID=1232681 RepID=R7ZPP8_9BACT|nr:MOSC N-terminal beta barrel domain-containing protein [Lunatimonas lonarensis]EON76043.1 Flavodoxin reductases (ferredoxin-NADPH reductases) family 1 [Lunatimonas lonarensis]